MSAPYSPSSSSSGSFTSQGRYVSSGSFITATQPAPSDQQTSLKQIQSLHSSLLSAVSNVQSKTSDILKGQERDLLRAFKMKLGEVNEELKVERDKNIIGSEEWRTRCAAIFAELTACRESTVHLSSQNANLRKENAVHKTKLKSRDEDREFLIKQIAALKKENARCRYFIEQLQMQLQGQSSLSLPAPSSDSSRLPAIGRVDDLQLGLINATPLTIKTATGRNNGNAFASTGGSLTSRPRASHGSTSSFTSSSAFPSTVAEPLTVAREQKYRLEIEKLKRRLDEEKIRARSAQNAYINELESRNHIQEMFLQCVDDVKAMAARSRTAGSQPFDTTKEIQFSQFTPKDRIAAVEWLISQEEVMNALFQLMFQTKHNKSKPSQPQPPAIKEDENGDDQKTADAEPLSLSS